MNRAAHTWAVSVVTTLFLVFPLGCSSTPHHGRTVSYPVPGANDPGSKEWMRIQTLISAGEWKAAAQTCQNYLKQYPQTPQVPEVSYLLGKSLHRSTQLQKAQTSLEEFITKYPDNPRVNEARYHLSMVFFKKNELTQSETHLSKVNIGYLSDAEDRFYAYLLAGKLAGVVQRFADSVNAYLLAYDSLPSGHRLLPATQKLIERTIEARLTIEEIEKIAQQRRSYFPGRFPEAFLYYTLARRQDAAGQKEQASANYQRAMEADPQLKNSLALPPEQAVDTSTPADLTAVGVLLPLSGDWGEFGRATLEGMQLASGMFAQKSGKAPPIRLLIRDTKGDVEVAREAFNELVDIHKVAAVIGPLTSKDADVIAELAQKRKVPLLVLSQKSGLTEKGDFVFRASMTLKMQAQAVAQEAFHSMGLKRFAILYPRDPYGIELAKEFWREIESLGGAVSAVESYATGQTDFRDELRRLVGTQYINARKKEYARIQDSVSLLAKGKNKKNEKGELMPIIDFEALFIPDGYKAIGQIAPTLTYLDIDGIRLLGTNAWNSNQLIERAWPYVEGSVFVDGFFADSSRPEVSSFVALYRSSFKKSPTIHAAQGYDSMKLTMAALAQSSSSMRSAVRDALVNVKGFSGPSGRMVKFNESRDAQKELFLITPKNKKLVERIAHPVPVVQ